MKVKKILISQAKPSTDRLLEIADRYEVEMVFRPFVKVEGLTARDFRQQKVSISDYTAIIFTSRTAIDHFFRLCEEMRVTIPDTLKYFCTSESIALYLQKYIVYRKRKIFFAQSGKIEDLQPNFQRHNKEKYLLCTGEGDTESADAVLQAAKLDCTKVVMYRTVSNDFGPDEAFDYDMLVFFSPAGISALKKNFPDFEQGDIQIVCLGSATAQAVRDAGLRLDIEAGTPAVPSVVMGLERFLRRQEMEEEEEEEAAGASAD